MRKVIILGATGSIGTTALNAIREGKIDAKVVALVAHSSIERTKELASEFNCPYYINSSNEGLTSFLNKIEADIVLNGIAGSPGLFASIASLEAGFDLALANKESIVMGGEFLLSLAKKLGRRIIPVDSEHSAIYHLICDHKDVSSLVITASGGPFLGRKDLYNVTVEEAINHPTWKMGKKISVDSATLANKGLEVIEAGFLFNMKAEDIEVTIHRQSIVHSLIRLKNGSVYAQPSPPDMTLPILSAIADGSQILEHSVKPLSFSNLDLTFRSWDRNEFPLLSLAYEALKKRASYPIAFNAANEEAVHLFLSRRLHFTDIAKITEEVMQYEFSSTCNDFESIVNEDKRARELALEKATKWLY